MAQKVKNLVYSLLWLQWVLWCGFNPWPGNSQPKKKKLMKKQENFIQANLRTVAWETGFQEAPRTAGES